MFRHFLVVDNCGNYPVYIEVTGFLAGVDLGSVDLFMVLLIWELNVSLGIWVFGILEFGELEIGNFGIGNFGIWEFWNLGH